LLAADGERRELELEEHWLHKGHVVLKFRGIDSISEAERLADAQVQIRASERRKLEPGTEYISDLVGCCVIDLGHTPTAIGVVRDVQSGAGEAPLLVIEAEAGKREILVPLAAEYLRKVDVAAKRIEMVLPEGMLALDAPLTKEEKDRLSRGE
jgi:16S rRNA processing protein RimM